MDASRTLKNRRGIAIVYLAFLLVALVALAGLVIDLGYVFVAKSQLQNAADAGALAGAGYYKDELIKKFKSETPYTIDNAQIKISAENIAESNKAAAASVQIANDISSNTITSTNDITLGFWNYSGLTTNKYNDINPSTVNAVKVRARRTSDSPAGPVNTFLARVLGKDLFDVEATAIAAIPAGAGRYIAFCETACSTACTYPNICTIDPPRVMEKPVGSQGTFPFERALTWTTLTLSPSSSDIINGLLCTEQPYKQVCSKLINTNTGSINAQFQNLESLMYNVSLDSSNKEFDDQGKVIGWWTIVPVMEKNPAFPSECLLDDDHQVVKYALIRIKVICSSGNVGTNTPNEEPLCTGNSKAPSNLCGGGKPYPNDSIVIDKMS